MKAIVTSDWHLGGLARLYPLDHIDRQFKQIEKIYQHAVKQGIEHIFVPGDISDTPFMDYLTYEKLINLLMEYDQHVTTYYMAGNHDFSDKKRTSMDLLNALTNHSLFTNFHIFLTPKQIEVEGIVVNMLPFPYLTSIKNKRPVLNFVHTEVSGVIGDNGRVIKTDKDIVRKDRDFTISGHIHKYQYMKKQRVLYCGNPYQKNFGETCTKGFLEIEAVENKGKLTVDHTFVTALPNYTLININISCTEDLSSLLVADDNIRYKVTVTNDVFLPDDLRIRYPNIHTIVNSNHVSLVKDLEEETHYSAVDLTSGLSEYLKKSELDKKQVKTAKSLVQVAMKELGL